MLKRQYGIFKYPDGDIRLSIKFLDEKYQTLGEFFITEVHDFYLDIREALESVISGNMEEYAFDGNLLGIEIGKEITEVYFQFEEEILGNPCLIPTNELYKLVLEWKEIEDRMHRGKDIFPLMIED